MSAYSPRDPRSEQSFPSLAFKLQYPTDSLIHPTTAPNDLKYIKRFTETALPEPNSRSSRYGRRTAFDHVHRRSTRPRRSSRSTVRPVRCPVARSPTALLTSLDEKPITPPRQAFAPETDKVVSSSSIAAGLYLKPCVAHILLSDARLQRNLSICSASNHLISRVLPPMSRRHVRQSKCDRQGAVSSRNTSGPTTIRPEPYSGQSGQYERCRPRHQASPWPGVASVEFFRRRDRSLRSWPPHVRPRAVPRERLLPTERSCHSHVENQITAVNVELLSESLPPKTRAAHPRLTTNSTASTPVKACKIVCGSRSLQESARSSRQVDWSISSLRHRSLRRVRPDMLTVVNRGYCKSAALLRPDNPNIAPPRRRHPVLYGTFWVQLDPVTPRQGDVILRGTRHEAPLRLAHGRRTRRGFVDPPGPGFVLYRSGHHEQPQPQKPGHLLV